MKFPILLIITSLILSCNAPDKNITVEKETLQREDDSLKNAIQSETPANIPDTSVTDKPEANVEKAGVHPISLQWISWDKKGEVRISPAGDGWYTIKGRQSNAEDDYLIIDGKIKRLSEKELEFEGSIVTKVSHLNNGEPCNKTGRQIFAAKGNRKYFRLQQMDNCEGGSVVDYVDIYPGTSSL